MFIRSQIFAWVLLGFAAGCGSHSDDTTPSTETETETDTGVADVATDTQKPPVDAATETAPTGCETAVPSDFTCPEPKKGTPATSCTEAMLEDFVQKCLATDLSVPSTCDAWKAANPACAGCISSFALSALGHVYPNSSKCRWGIMDPACATASNCTYYCQQAVCASCDVIPGPSGKSDSDLCAESVSLAGGKCWEVSAQKADECSKKYDLDNCNVDEMYAPSPNLTKMQQQILRLYRGACRDNGNWTNATSAGGDAGTSDAADAG
jgi:hypothetical protein